MFLLGEYYQALNTLSDKQYSEADPRLQTLLVAQSTTTLPVYISFHSFTLRDRRNEICLRGESASMD